MLDALETVIEEAAAIPGAFGAVLCDFEGESVVARLGLNQLPSEIENEARKHVPDALRSELSVGEFLLRLAAAEPCSMLLTFGRSPEAEAGRLHILEIGFARVGLVVMTLPEDFYLVIVLDRQRTRGFGQARWVAQKLRSRLVREIT